MIKNKQKRQLNNLRAVFGKDALISDFHFKGGLPCLDREKPAGERHHHSENARCFEYKGKEYYQSLDSGLIFAVEYDNYNNIIEQYPCLIGTSQQHKAYQDQFFGGL